MSMKELRPYQDTIVTRVINSNSNMIICLPTGGGKTVIANALMSKIDGYKVFIVPRLELIKQAHDEFGDVDVIWSNKTSLTGKDVIISSKDSLRTQYDKVPHDKPLTLIFDEAHISIEQTFNIVQALKPDRVLGLTATPERMDGLALLKGTDAIHKFGVFDEVLKTETVPSLINKKFLAPLRYYTRPIDGITNVKAKSATGDELTGAQMTDLFTKNHVWGDLVQCYKEYGVGRPAIGFTPTVKMADQVSAIFQEAGYDFRTIHGQMSVKEREDLIEKLKNGEIDGLVNAALLTYGFDCPVASYAFSCRHIKSRPLWFQMVGRVLRTAEGKKDAIFIDHGDSISEFSEPECPLPILDELIQWKADGETLEEKEARKENLKKVQETMKILQELDPIPSEMVEVTTENTYSRLIRVINSLREENKLLLQQKESFEKEQKRLAKAVNEANLRSAQLEQKNKELAGNRIRKIDKDATFEFVRVNYCKIRRWIENDKPEMMEKYGDSHKATVEWFKKKQNYIDFIYDDYTFANGMAYWKNHYSKNWRRK